MSALISRVGMASLLLIQHATVSAGDGSFTPRSITNVARFLDPKVAGLSSRGMAVDSQGNVYVAGPGAPPGGITTPGAAFPASDSASNLGEFLVKMDPRGATVYSTYLPGYGYYEAVTVDPKGNVFVANCTKLGATFQVLITEIDATGSKILYSQTLGGSRLNPVERIALDAQGNIYIAGETDSPDFPITKGSLPTPFRPGNFVCQSSNCLANAFVTKIDPRTSQILYSTFIGGSGREAIRGLAVDSAGNAYVAERLHRRTSR